MTTHPSGQKPCAPPSDFELDLIPQTQQWREEDKTWWKYLTSHKLGQPTVDHQEQKSIVLGI
jgi:hypothetical protein